MEGLKIADTSGLPFMELRNDDMFYVDKSMLIADILGTNPRAVYLYTRPRRFGKSTNISMLDAFFNIEYAGNTWFDGLEISEHHEFDAYRNAFPVIYVDLKDSVSEDYESFLAGFRNIVRRAFEPFVYLLESDSLRADQRSEIQSVLDRTISKDDMRFCVSDLCTMLERHHGTKALVLIDEYDRAVTDTFGTDHHKPIIGFLSGFMSSTLKGNRSLQMAYITGVMQVAKSGMFSGVNNLRVNNLFSERSDERFGFTESEVRGILEYYGRTDRMDEVREWYDGYRFGDAEVYNPFSVMSYVSSDFRPYGYWANSGSDKPMRWMLARTDSSAMDVVSRLVSGMCSTTDIHLEMTYDDLRLAEPKELFSLMVMTGYLKAVPKDDGRYDISIPNREVMGIIEEILKGIVNIDDGMFMEFCASVLDADAERMESALRFLFGGASHRNLDHRSIEVALLFVMRGMLRDYDVRTEREEGNGVTDIILRPRRDGVAPVIIGIKVAGTESSLDGEAEAAIRQIHDRRYHNLMSGRVILIGIAFRGVIPRVRCETPDLRPRGLNTCRLYTCAMRILGENPSGDGVKVLIETDEDIWHLYNVIEVGDLVTASTTRREEKSADKLRAERAEKKRMTLGVRIEKIEFSEDDLRLKLLGTIETGPQDIGQHHTLIFETGDSLLMTKSHWRDTQLERLKRAVTDSRKPRIVFVSLDQDEATIAVLRQYGLKMVTEVRSGRSGKQYAEKPQADGYHGEILSKVVPLMEPNMPIVVLGPGFEKESLAEDMKKAEPELFKRIHVYHTGQCGMAGINELIKTGMGGDLLRESAVGAEIEAVEQLMTEIARNGLGTYGTQQVRDAAMSGAVEKLLVLDSKIREQDLDDVVRAVESQKGTVIVVSGQHDGGKELASLGGMGALLRYRTE